MKHIAAYALLVLAGKKPSAADVEKVIKEAGASPDSEQVKALIEALKDKEFHELVGEGMKTLGSMGTGSGAAAGGAAKPDADAGGKPDEAPAEEEEEDDVDMGGLFGDEY